jgi:hypothetical protein
MTVVRLTYLPSNFSFAMQVTLSSSIFPMYLVITL